MPQATVIEMVCPHCGWMYGSDRGTIVPPHPDEKETKLCPGSFQKPRNPEIDLGPLWKDQPR